MRIPSSNAGLGATPAFSSVGTLTESATLAATHAVAYPATVAAGDLLICVAFGENGNSDASLAMHANMSVAGWQHLTGSPFGNVSQTCLLVAWKFAVGNEGGTNIPGGIVATGGASSDTFLGHCQGWTAANGFAAMPFESISSTIESPNFTTAAPTVTPTDGNRRGVALFGASTNTTMGAFTGATGGTWTVASSITTAQGGTCGIHTQTADLSVGTLISGGSVTTPQAAGGPLIGFALVPTGTGDGNGGGTAPKWMAYYPAYDQGAMPGTEVPFELGITHLKHFAAMPQLSGGVSSVNLSFFNPPMVPTNLADIKSARTAAGSTAKILMVIGGANSNGNFVNAIDNNETQLIHDILSKAQTNGYDGVDVDWEGWTADTIGYTRMVNFHAALGEELHTEGLVFTSSSWGRNGPAFDAAKAAFKTGVIDPGHIDYIYIQFIAMALPGFSQSMVWHHSATNHNQSDYGTPVFQVGLTEALPRYINTTGWPANKLIVGHQWGALRWTRGSMTSPAGSSGRGARFPIDSWASGGKQPTTGSEELYRQIIALAQYPESLHRDVAAGQIPFLGHTGASASQDFFLPFEDAQSIAYKTAYALSQGVAGMGVWHIASDYNAAGTTVVQKHPLAAALSQSLYR